jgi:hypothetical protein
LDADSLNELLQERISSIMADKNNVFMKAMNDAIATDLANKTLTVEGLDKEGTMDKYMDLIDMDGIYNLAYSGLCTSYDGMIISDANNAKQCTYKTKEQCDKNYTWYNPGGDVSPIGEDETYSEWLPYNNANYSGNACVVSSFAVRQTCENVGRIKDTPLTYVPGGTCQLTEKYCTLMGASSGANPKYGGALDCHFTNASKFMQGLLGDTVTKGLAATFFRNGYIYNAVTDVYMDIVPESIRHNKMVLAFTSQLTPMMFIPGYSQYKTVMGLIEALKDPVKTYKDLETKVNKFGSDVSNIAINTSRELESLANQVSSGVSGLAFQVGDFATDAANAVANTATDFGNSVANTATDFGNSVSNTATDFGNSVSNTATDFGNSVSNTATGAANAYVNTAANLFGGLNTFTVAPENDPIMQAIRAAGMR